jgi:serine/threonine-protein phosphatase 2A regulatory subunit B''
VITRIFYSVNKCHSGRITSRQVRRSDLLEAFSLVDEEEDINNGRFLISCCPVSS